jgi:hypothetical protein
MAALLPIGVPAFFDGVRFVSLVHGGRQLIGARQKALARGIRLFRTGRKV